jgi:hypothetical protein
MQRLSYKLVGDFAGEILKCPVISRVAKNTHEGSSSVYPGRTPTSTQAESYKLWDDFAGEILTNVL